MIRAFVFARGGSKGCPGKNTRLLGGKPLIAHAVNHAQIAVGNCTVSTDSDEIARIARNFGADVLMRPAELATDDSPEWLSWRHAVDNIPCDAFVSVPCTTPFRIAEDIKRTIGALDIVDVALTLTQNHDTIVSMDKLGVVRPGAETYARRQDRPAAYRIAGSCYATTPQFIRDNNSLWDGIVRGVIVPQERALDIDTEYDFRVAEALWQQQHPR